MAIVGPRPTIPAQVTDYTPRQHRRHEVRPGLTGWAQVQGRAGIPWEERIELDVEYVDRRSLWLDLRILAQDRLAARHRPRPRPGLDGGRANRLRARCQRPEQRRRWPTALLEVAGLRLLTDPTFDTAGRTTTGAGGTISRKLQDHDLRAAIWADRRGPAQPRPSTTTTSTMPVARCCPRTGARSIMTAPVRSGWPATR